jgi:hypothetical protein
MRSSALLMSFDSRTYLLSLKPIHSFSKLSPQHSMDLNGDEMGDEEEDYDSEDEDEMIQIVTNGSVGYVTAKELYLVILQDVVNLGEELRTNSQATRPYAFR